jgi:cell division protein FtsB
MDDEQKANEQEFDKLHRHIHELNRQVDSLEKSRQTLVENVRTLQNIMLDAIADLKAGIEE